MKEKKEDLHMSSHAYLPLPIMHEEPGVKRDIGARTLAPIYWRDFLKGKTGSGS